MAGNNMTALSTIASMVKCLVLALNITKKAK